MPVYRIYRLREARRSSFRWAPHASGVTSVKPKDYEEDGTTEAPTPYAAWFRMKDTEAPLQVGDLLEVPDGELRICKYVGFEEARWVLPQAEPSLEMEPPPTVQPQTQNPAG